MFPSRKKKRLNQNSPRRSQVTALLGQSSCGIFRGVKFVSCSPIPQPQKEAVTCKQRLQSTTASLPSHTAIRGLKNKRTTSRTTRNKKQHRKKTIVVANFSSGCFKVWGNLLLHLTLAALRFEKSFGSWAGGVRIRFVRREEKRMILEVRRVKRWKVVPKLSASWRRVGQSGTIGPLPFWVEGMWWILYFQKVT